MALITGKIGLLVGILFVCVSCTTTGPPSGDPDRLLTISDGPACDPGLIRPPGVSACLSIQALLTSNPPTAAPVGKCPQGWQRYQFNRFCLPAIVVTACGEKTYPCDRDPGDILKTQSGPPNCPDGTRVVETDVPLSDDDGMILAGSRPALACGPPGRLDPL